MAQIKFSLSIVASLLLSGYSASGGKVLWQKIDLGSPKVTQLPERPVKASFREGIPVIIGDRGPFRFGLDTGQSTPYLLSPAFARELGLLTVGKVRPGDASGRSSPPVDWLSIPALSIGEARFKDLRGIVVDSARQDGGLGFGLFVEGLLTLDFRRGTFELRRGRLPPDAANLLPYSAEYGIPVIDIEIAELAVTAMLDSGANGQYLMLPKQLSEKLPLYGDLELLGPASTLFNQDTLWGATLNGTLAVGPWKIQDPALSFSELIQEALLGRRFMEQYVLTFDTSNHLVQLTQVETE